MLWGKSRPNLNGTIVYVRFEFEATIVHIKTWDSKQLYFMLDFYLLMPANTNIYMCTHLYVKKISSEFFVRIRSNINILQD